jgi:hypothetical protein
MAAFFQEFQEVRNGVSKIERSNLQTVHVVDRFHTDLSSGGAGGEGAAHVGRRLGSHVLEVEGPKTRLQVSLT